MRKKEIKEIKDQIQHYKLLNHLSTVEFCNEFELSYTELASITCGEYSIVSKDVLKKIADVIYEPF